MRATGSWEATKRQQYFTFIERFYLLSTVSTTACELGVPLDCMMDMRKLRL